MHLREKVRVLDFECKLSLYTFIHTYIPTSYMCCENTEKQDKGIDLEMLFKIEYTIVIFYCKFFFGSSSLIK